MSGVHVCYAPGCARELHPEQVSRCGVLRDLSHIHGTAELPFSADDFGLWQDFEAVGCSEVSLLQAAVLLKVPTLASTTTRFFTKQGTQ